ncbi:hypothetical protein EPI10_000852 [Gossypium australe]|uniref:Uncharacterized protein n=1 Tax=Gossypium australe TaxID=47621 RepID=A0A5B6V991_9ROSI|nr:hypothetical protein EPI10_000852 [Gossypium australe]
MLLYPSPSVLGKPRSSNLYPLRTVYSPDSSGYHFHRSFKVDSQEAMHLPILLLNAHFQHVNHSPSAKGLLQPRCSTKPKKVDSLTLTP